MSKNDKPRLSKLYYVYGLYEEGSEDPFYIGKGNSRRPKAHIYEAKRGHKCPKCAKIRKIWASGKKVECWALVQTEDQAFAYAEEIRIIAEYGTSNLTNLTVGGEGRMDTPELIAERAYQAMLMHERIKIADIRRKTGSTRKLV